MNTRGNALNARRHRPSMPWAAVLAGGGAVVCAGLRSRERVAEGVRPKVGAGAVMWALWMAANGLLKPPRRAGLKSPLCLPFPRFRRGNYSREKGIAFRRRF